MSLRGGSAISDKSDPKYPNLGPAKFLPSSSNRRQLFFQYDTEKYDFRKIILEIFKCSDKIGEAFANLSGNDEMEEALNSIHQLTWPNKPFRQGGGRGRSNLTPWHTEYAKVNRPHGPICSKSDRERALFEQYEAMLRDFCINVVAPLLGTFPGGIPII